MRREKGVMKADGFYYTHDLSSEALDFIINSFNVSKEERYSKEATYWKFDDSGNIEWLLSSPCSTVGRWVLYHWGEKLVGLPEEMLEYLLRHFVKPTHDSQKD